MPKRTAMAMAAIIAMAPQAAFAKHIKIWLKAFIPNAGLQIVEKVPGSPGHTMIPGPHVLGIPVDGTCYNTNDRGFSSSPSAEAKISIVTEFDVLSPGIGNIIKTAPQIGESIRYDCGTGSVLGRKSASSQDVKLGEPSYNAGVVTFAVDAEASNPFVPLPPAISPSIKMHGTFTVDVSRRKARFVGTVAKFPSYEAYVAMDARPPIAVFQLSPAADASPWSLVFNVALDKSASF